MVYPWTIVLLLCGICSSDMSINCAVPLADGTWLSSSRGTWMVNTTTIAGFSSSLSASSPTSTLSFVSNAGTLHLFSTTSSIFGVSITFYTCLDFQISTTSVPLFYIVTVFNNTVSDRFTGDSNAACSNTGYQTVDNRNILVLQGADTSLTAILPNVIRGEYAVNFTSTSGMTSDGVALDTCNDTTVMRFNTSGGGQNVGFSIDGFLTSLYSTQSGSITYIYTYNNDSTVDDSTTYRIVCWAVSYSSFGVSASAYPGNCQHDQNATYTPQGGQLFALTPSLICASDDDSSDSDVTVIIIVVCVVVGVIIFLIVVIIIYFKKKKAKKRKNDENDLKKEGLKKDVSVSTLKDSSDSTCLPWLGKGTKTISTSTSDLHSITFYLPLKYTKRPDDMTNGAPANKRPRAAGLQRSKTNLSAVDEVDGEKISKQPVRFIPYVGVIKKDTKTKPVVETHWQNVTPKANSTSSKSISVKEELSRAKTFHDFEKEFDKKNKFPVDIKHVPKIESKTTKTLNIGNVTNTSTSSSRVSKNEIVKVRSHEELDRISHDTSGGEGNKADNGELNNDKPGNAKTLYFKRSRTIPGINYTSPYAMTKEQKDYFAHRKAWVTLQHTHEQAKQKWLKEVKRKENESAFTNWIRYKSVMAGKMRESLKRTHSEPSKTLDASVPK